MPNGGINKQRYFDIDRFMSKNTVLFCGIFKGGILYNKTKHKKPRVVNSVQRTAYIMSQLFFTQRGAVGRSRSLLFEFLQLKSRRYALDAKP